LSALLLAFANRDPSLIVDARFDGEGDDLTLVVPGAGVGDTLRFHGLTAGSPTENGSSGYVRGRPALAVLARNKWFEVEETVGGLRIRLWERARKLGQPSESVRGPDG